VAITYEAPPEWNILFHQQRVVTFSIRFECDRICETFEFVSRFQYSVPQVQVLHFFFPFDVGFGLRLVLIAMGQVARFLAADLVVAVAFFGLLVRVFRYTYEERMRPVVDLAADAFLDPVAAVKSCFSWWDAMAGTIEYR
jgi:hypothetical protein